MQKKNWKYIIGIAIGIAIGYFAFAAWHQSALAPSRTPSTHIYQSQQDCEQKTGKSCGFTTCDYIPEGKTYEEVCGEGFTDGWQPTQ